MDSPIGSPIAIAPHPVARHLQPKDNKLGPFLEKIIDKKVNQVALNAFEWLADKFCSYFYTAYCHRLTARLAQLPIPKNGQPLPKMPQVAQKVSHFADGAILYDYTVTQRAEIRHSVFVNLLTKEKTVVEDIYVDNKRVRFTDIPRTKLLFGKAHGTQEVVVTDTRESSELVMIYERDTSGNLKAWCVDTRQPVKEISMAGQVPVATQEVFLAKEIPAMPAHLPIYEPII